MTSNLLFLLKKHIIKNINEIFIDNFYKTDFQYINNIDLLIENYIMLFYKNSIIIISIDINNKDILNTLDNVINLKNVKIFDKLQEIKRVFIINVNTKYFHNKNNCVKIDEIKLKINTLTLKNNHLYELFISTDIKDHLIMLKDMIKRNIDY